MDVCTQFENNNNNKKIPLRHSWDIMLTLMGWTDGITRQKNNPHWITSIYLKKSNYHTHVPKIHFPVKERPEQAKQPTTSQRLPTYTKLIMSDSSSLICCTNFIGKLHRLEENLAMTEWVNSMKLITNMVTLSKTCRVSDKSPSGEHAQIHTFVHI